VTGDLQKRQPRRIRIVCSVVEQSTAALEDCAMIVRVPVIYHEPYHNFWLPERGALVENAEFRSTVAALIIEQYLLLVFTIFEVLEGPIHGGSELETSNCN
jgi:hypothetical protein